MKQMKVWLWIINRATSDEDITMEEYKNRLRIQREKKAHRDFRIGGEREKKETTKTK